MKSLEDFVNEGKGMKPNPDTISRLIDEVGLNYNMNENEIDKAVYDILKSICDKRIITKEVFIKSVKNVIDKI